MKAEHVSKYIYINKWAHNSESMPLTCKVQNERRIRVSKSSPPIKMAQKIKFKMGGEYHIRVYLSCKIIDRI